MKGNGIDVGLMDFQYAPRVLDRRVWTEMERPIAEIARRAHIGPVRRFEIMQERDRIHKLAPATMIGPDRLDMADASYGCLACQLADPLARNWLASANSRNLPGTVPTLWLVLRRREACSAPAPRDSGDTTVPMPAGS